MNFLHPALGSPPRVRGEVLSSFLDSFALGITPACAGRRRRYPLCFARDEDHPRVCGEKKTLETNVVKGKGSPPRVRGEAFRIAYSGSRCRITPRVCGEKQFPHNTTPDKGGSPPRVRGEVDHDVVELRETGITPACAGRSARACATSQCPRDHPRVCGEKSTATSIQSSSCGSPPRVRGEADQGHQSPHRGRITPACAGRRYIRDTAGGNDADHPRVCGEKYSAKAFRCKTPGSPPRVRGEALYFVSESETRRITPACAGRSCFLRPDN